MFNENIINLVIKQTNYSRDEAIEKLSKKHKEHMDVYGKDNDKRMTGKHETASFYKFTE